MQHGFRHLAEPFKIGILMLFSLVASDPVAFADPTRSFETVKNGGAVAPPTLSKVEENTAKKETKPGSEPLQPEGPSAEQLNASIGGEFENQHEELNANAKTLADGTRDPFNQGRRDQHTQNVNDRLNLESAAAKLVSGLGMSSTEIGKFAASTTAGIDQTAGVGNPSAVSSVANAATPVLSSKQQAEPLQAAGLADLSSDSPGLMADFSNETPSVEVRPSDVEGVVIRDSLPGTESIGAITKRDEMDSANKSGQLQLKENASQILVNFRTRSEIKSAEKETPELVPAEILKEAPAYAAQSAGNSKMAQLALKLASGVVKAQLENIKSKRMADATPSERTQPLEVYSGKLATKPVRRIASIPQVQPPIVHNNPTIVVTGNQKQASSIWVRILVLVLSLLTLRYIPRAFRKLEAIFFKRKGAKGEEEKPWSPVVGIDSDLNLTIEDRV